MVIISDCLSEDGSSILPRVAKYISLVLTAALRSPKPQDKVRILGGMPVLSIWTVRLSVRTLGFHPGKRGSTPLRGASLFPDSTEVVALRC